MFIYKFLIQLNYKWISFWQIFSYWKKYKNTQKKSYILGCSERYSYFLISLYVVSTHPRPSSQPNFQHSPCHKCIWQTRHTWLLCRLFSLSTLSDFTTFLKPVKGCCWSCWPLCVICCQSSWVTWKRDAPEAQSSGPSLWTSPAVTFQAHSFQYPCQGKVDSKPQGGLGSSVRHVGSKKSERHSCAPH